MSKVAIYIGRFQPFHLGHVSVIRSALGTYDHLIVLVGSSGRSRDIKNPFTFSEREGMILRYLNDISVRNRVVVGRLRDYPYNDNQWIRHVQETVNILSTKFWGDHEFYLVGTDRDESTWYLKVFPQWKSDLSNPVIDVSGTDVRKILFENSTEYEYKVPQVTKNFIDDFRSSKTYNLLCEEYKFIQGYRKSWEVAPYPPTFVTVDACVIQSGHVLAVSRRAMPGKGLWALPGGFVSQNESLKSAMIRELREETKLKVPTPVLEGSIVTSKVFDHPDRSLRGRTITHTFLIRLDDKAPLPKVKGSDDAERAFWLPIQTALHHSSYWFEDHYDMIETMVSVPTS